MRRIVRILLLLFLALLVTAGLGLFGVYRATQQVPEFYQTAMKLERADQAVAGDEMERNVLGLRNDLQEQGRWEARFTEKQINGWLAVDLPEKFTTSLPKGISNPRVSIGTEGTRIAFRYQGPRISTVVSLAGTITLTDETNVIAVRIAKVRAGLLPLPLKDFLDDISDAARRSDLNLRWSTQDGDPVALIRVPTVSDDYDYEEVFIDRIETADGELILSGHTGANTTAMLDHQPQNRAVQ